MGLSQSPKNGDEPGLLSGARCPHRVLLRGRKESESEMEQAGLRVVTMEEEATSQGSGASRSWKWQERFSLEPRERPALPRPGFRPMRPMSNP